MRFTTKDGLKNHMHSAHYILHRFQCDLCWKLFSFKSDLLSHVQSVHNDNKDFPCNQCDKSFPLATYLEKHKATVHVTKQEFKCDLCDKSFKDLDRHMKTVHEKRRDKKCPYCERVFSSIQNVRAHVRIAHEGPVQQQQQKQQPDLQQQQQQQQQAEEPSIKIMCDNCDSVFSSEKQLLWHKEVVHSAEKSPSENSQNKVEPEESVGGSSAMEILHKQEQQKLLKIQEASSEDGPSETSGTGSGSAGSSARMLQCEFCDKTLGTKFALKLHVDSVHYGIQRFSCSEDGCDKMFLTQVDMSRHVDVVHR